MRVISQDGTIDVPYEQVVIQRFNRVIYFLNKNLTGVESVTNDMEMASYSTEEKAKKCLELRIQEVLPCFRTLSLQKKLMKYSKNAIHRSYMQALTISHRKLNLRIIKIFIFSSQQRKNWSSL